VFALRTANIILLQLANLYFVLEGARAARFSLIDDILCMCTVPTRYPAPPPLSGIIFSIQNHPLQRKLGRGSLALNSNIYILYSLSALLYIPLFNILFSF